MDGLQSREVHIRLSQLGDLIVLGFLKFGRFPNGGYNIEKEIRGRCTAGGLIPANFSWIFPESGRSPKGVAI